MSTPSTPNQHLFIVWPSAGAFQEAVLDRLRENFTILDLRLVHWSKSAWSGNLARFYGKAPADLERKLADIGFGPFLAVITQSKNPGWNLRYTSRGFRLVQSDAFDAKTELRDLVGGEARIHSTITPAEYRRDLTLVFGPDFEPRNHDQELPQILDWRFEPAGTNGWPDLDAVFTMLKIASRYVVLRDGLRPASLAPLYALGRDEVGADIDLLVEDRADAAFLLNAAPTGGAKTTNYHAFVGGVEIKLDIYEICDGSFDSRWAQAMLDGRIIANDVAIPDPINEFYSLLYHCLLRKTFIKLSHMNRLLTLSKLMGKPMTWEHLINRPNAIAMLTQFMSRKRYSFTKPNYSNAETNENWAKEVPVTKEVTNSIIGSLSKSPAHSSKQNDYFLRQIWRTRWFNGDDVAVKLVRTTDEKVSGRLFREGEFLKAMGGVFSPKLYFEVTGRTQYFLVSEWIEGRTLDDLLTAPEFSGNWRRIREHLQSLFSAIQSTGIVHNDIRGTNIIIRDNDARILDFGNSYWLKDPLDQILPTRDDKEAIDDLLRAVDREISSNVGKTI